MNLKHRYRVCYLMIGMRQMYFPGNRCPYIMEAIYLYR